MSAKPTHYKILGVSETATPEEIKTAWRDLAKKYHPDRNKGKKAAARIKDVNVAYHELIDPGRRFNYDATLRAERAAAAHAAASAAASSFTDADDDSTIPPSGQGATPQPPPPPASGQQPSASTVQPTWTVTDMLLAVGQLVWARLRSIAIAALIILAVMAGGSVLVFLLFIGTTDRTPAPTPVAVTQPAVYREDEGPGSNPRPASLPSSAQSLPSVTVRLEPIAYSYTTRSWANFNPTYSSGYPHVYGLGFHNSLGWGAGMNWTGNYSASGDRLILSIENLRLPGEVESTIARQMGQLDWWSDVGVGYHVELQGALFEDHSMAKDLIIFRTFLGDTPPPRVEKTFRIIPTTNGEAPLVQVRGEWKGVYEVSGNRVPFVMRLEQEGDEISGATMEISYDKRRRSSIRGRVEGSQVTFLKRYGDGGGTVSYVSTEADSRRLRGTWQKGLEQGPWQAEWTADFTDMVDDLPTTISKEEVASRSSAASEHQDDESWRLRPMDRHRLQRSGGGSSSFSRRREKSAPRRIQGPALSGAPSKGACHQFSDREY